MNSEDKAVLGGLVLGAVAGGVVAGLVFYNLGEHTGRVNAHSGKQSTAKVFMLEKEGEKREVLRTYEKERPDAIFVESEDEYVALESYLSEIDGRYDRELERQKIYKLVDWYGEEVRK